MTIATHQHNRYHRLIRFLPTWKGNLILFGLLIFVVLAYFYLQVQNAQSTFLQNAGRNAATVADVVERNARSTLVAQDAVTEIMETFLGNTARFVDYLDNIERFSPGELASFAQEAGLAGIRIDPVGAGFVEGPPGWISLPDSACTPTGGIFQHEPADHLYCLIQPLTRADGCIIVGIASQRIESLREQISLPHLLETLSGLPGIQYVKIEPTRFGQGEAQPFVTMVDRQGQHVAEIRVAMESDDLVLGLDAQFLSTRTYQLWVQFAVFGTLLAFLGLFFSWLLYRFQDANLRQVRSFERELARQHEDAALGRSAASIAHEIRNPLNSIGMGLQRIQMESEGLTEEHARLIRTMLKAVERTNSIVKDIRRYASPLEPQQRDIRLHALLDNLLPLYQQQCDHRGIAVTRNDEYDATIPGDRDLLEEAIENLIKNAIEAQSQGGFLDIHIHRTADSGVITFENGGFALPTESVEWILEPYYTTKTRGTGLGLAITRRILTAHGGRMELSVPREGVLRISVHLPLA